MNAILRASFIPIRQAEPPEGRAGYPLFQSSGAALAFVTGDEVFEFSWNSFPSGMRRPSAILSAFIDAYALTAGKNLYITVGSQTPGQGFQRFVIPGGTDPGYIIITAPGGTPICISTDAGAAGQVAVILYNYNAFNTGTQAVVPGGSGASGSPSGSTSSPATSSSGTGSSTGGGGTSSPLQTAGGGGVPTV